MGMRVKKIKLFLFQVFRSCRISRLKKIRAITRMEVVLKLKTRRKVYHSTKYYSQGRFMRIRANDQRDNGVVHKVNTWV